MLCNTESRVGPLGWGVGPPGATPITEHSAGKSKSVLGFSAVEKEKAEVSPAFPGLW